MRTVKTSVLLSLIGAVLVGATPALAAESARHSGTVVSVDPKLQTLVVDELGANATSRKLNVHVAPQTQMLSSTRNPQATDAQHEFTDTPITLADIKPGDFVVVDLKDHGNTAMADSVMVTLSQGSRK